MAIPTGINSAIYDHQPIAFPTERAKEVGSEGSAAGGGCSDLSEWQRSTIDAAVRGKERVGHRNSPHGNVDRCKSFSAADKMFFIMPPVADAARAQRVPRSTRDAGAPSARPTPDTANVHSKSILTEIRLRTPQMFTIPYDSPLCLAQL